MLICFRLVTSSIITSSKPRHPSPADTMFVFQYERIHWIRGDHPNDAVTKPVRCARCFDRKSLWSLQCFPSVVEIPENQNIHLFFHQNHQEPPVFPFWKKVPEKLPGRPEYSALNILMLSFMLFLLFVLCSEQQQGYFKDVLLSGTFGREVFLRKVHLSKVDLINS